MRKWYMDDVIDEGVVISSRVRLARNIKKYPFSNIIDDEQSKALLEEVKHIITDRTHLGEQMHFLNLEEKSILEKQSLLEKHVLSMDLLKKNRPSGVLLFEDESVCVSLNEEDHIRIQSIFPGHNIENAFSLADKIDDLIEESVEYAFHKDYGYLTSCPTNTGTGLRASFMIHIPAIEITGQLRNVIEAISKFGMILRGIYGEGSEPMGSIYQISNQVTLGKSEAEIIDSLEKVTTFIIGQETKLRNGLLSQQKQELYDKICRGYGTLRYCKKISKKEAMDLLSLVRLGYLTNLLDESKPKQNIYHIMMGIQSGSLQQNLNRELTPAEIEVARANFINNNFM